MKTETVKAVHLVGGSAVEKPDAHGQTVACSYLGGVLKDRTASSGSRRRRVWDMPRPTLCPVIGVCLPLAALRHLVGKLMSGKGLDDDYEVHCVTISECTRRSPLAESLQRELDQRHAQSLRRFAQAKTGDTLATMWADALAGSDVAGALWAALTHPRCDTALQERICRDVHMLQHQRGAGNRADLQKLQELSEENAVLARELAAAQTRSGRLLAERAAQVDTLSAQLVRLRAEGIGKDSRIAALQQDLAALEAAAPGLKARIELARQAELQVQRTRELEREVNQLRQRWIDEAARADRLGRQLAAQAARPTLMRQPGHDAAGPDIDAMEAAEAAAALQDKAVLCVGGRTASVPVYRRLVECTGGRFLHHDGGEEHNSAQLEASLAAADLVICQTGCVSHGAYWRVKDHCKRTGKRCVFVDNPSASSLARGLRSIAREAEVADASETTRLPR